MSPCILTRNPDGTGTISCYRRENDPRDAQGHYWKAMAGTNVRECCLCGLRSRPEQVNGRTEIRYSTDAGLPDGSEAISCTWGVGKPTCKGRKP